MNRVLLLLCCFVFIPTVKADDLVNDPADLIGRLSSLEKRVQALEAASRTKGVIHTEKPAPLKEATAPLRKVIVNGRVYNQSSDGSLSACPDCSTGVEGQGQYYSNGQSGSDDGRYYAPAPVRGFFNRVFTGRGSRRGGGCSGGNCGG